MVGTNTRSKSDVIQYIKEHSTLFWIVTLGLLYAGSKKYYGQDVLWYIIGGVMIIIMVYNKEDDEEHYDLINIREAQMVAMKSVVGSIRAGYMPYIAERVGNSIQKKFQDIKVLPAKYGSGKLQQPDGVPQYWDIPIQIYSKYGLNKVVVVHIHPYKDDKEGFIYGSGQVVDYDVWEASERAREKSVKIVEKSSAQSLEPPEDDVIVK